MLGTCRSAFILASMLSGLALLMACTESGGGGTNASGAGTPVVSGFTVTGTGGLGGSDGGSGGSGDYFEALFYYGGINPYQDADSVDGGDIRILSTGQADASFAPTSQSEVLANYNLGDNPCVFTSDTTVAVEVAEPAVDSCYLIDSDSRLYKSDGDGTVGNSDAADETVTGFSVALGTTLTIELNQVGYASINLDDDVLNQGTITTDVDGSGDTGGLELGPESFFMFSSIDLSGKAEGDSGGYLNIQARNSIISHGNIDTSGADSSTGSAGDGGQVDLIPEVGFLEITGDINTNGGSATGSSGSGGDAGYIDLYTYYGNIFTSGTMNASGGSGYSAGGNGAYVYYYISYVGDVRNSGDVIAAGGDATNGPGGNGEYFGIETYGSQIDHNADVDVSGGSTTDTSSSGGDGGYVYVFSGNQYYVILEDSGGYMPPRDMNISGNLDTSGGDALATGSGSGGTAGYLYFEMDPDYSGTGQNISLLGYSLIDVSGGDGNYGGSGGYVDIYQEYGETDDSYPYNAGGDIFNEADLITRGGSVVAGATDPGAAGSYGGYVDMESDYDDYGHYYPNTAMRTFNDGDIDSSGGSSLNSGGSNAYGGGIFFWGYNRVENNGNVTSNGGSDLGADGGVDGYGSGAGDIEFYSNEVVDNSGMLTLDGGDGEYSAGSAGSSYLWAAEVYNSGNISGNGGDADDSLANSSGGGGAWIELWGGRVTENTGTLVADGGAGTSPGSEGDVIVIPYCLQGDCY